MKKCKLENFVKLFVRNINELSVLSESFTSDSSGQLDIFGHDGDSSSVDGS